MSTKNTTNLGIEQDDILVRIMLELVRAAILERDPAIPIDYNVDWDRLMDLSKNQGLIAWVWDGICRLPIEMQPPRLYRINWGMSAQEIWDRYEQQKKVLSEMVEICNYNNMRLLLMKGIGLSELYPKPESRPSGDLDIYLFNDYEKGNNLFGNGVNYFYNKHASYDYHGVHIENHVTPLDTDTKFEREIGSYLQSEMGNISLSTEGFYVFSPIANLVYLVTHSLHHFNPNQAVPLRNILDVIWFTWTYREKLSPSHCYQVMSKLGLDSTFELFLIMGEMVLGINMPEYHIGKVKQKHIDDIRNYILKSGSKLFVSDELSTGKQLQLLYQNYRQVKCIYYYLPSKNDNLLIFTFRHCIAVPLKCIFKIPKDMPFVEGLKNKYLHSVK